MRGLPPPLAILAPVLVGLALLLWSCQNDAAGPRTIPGHLAVAPVFSSSNAGLVDIARIRARLFRLEPNEVVLDTVADVAGDEINLQLTVMMETPTERFALVMELITAAGDTAFRAGPDTISPVTGNQTPVPVSVEIDYVGIGFDAALVQIVTQDTSLFQGQALTVVAEAIDSMGEPIPGTPIGFRSLDAASASFPDAGVGEVVAGGQRGTARLVAELLTGQADTALLDVQPLPSGLLIIEGNGQTGAPDTPLPTAIVVLVRGSDGVGVENVVVRFTTSGGGSFTPDSTLSDANGEVRTTWTLGPLEGTQTGTAATTQPAALQVSFTALATLGEPVAETLRWINALGGSWNVPANWDGGRVPTAQDTAVIGIDGTFTVTLDRDVSVASLDVGGGAGTQTLAVSNATLTVLGDSRTRSGGELLLVNGNVQGSAIFTNSGALVVQSDQTGSLFGPAIINDGLMDIQLGALILQGGGTLTGTISIGEALLDLGAGTFTVVDGLAVTGPVSVQGATLEIPSGTVTFDFLTMVGGAVTGSGTLDITSTFVWDGGTMTDPGVTRTGAGSINQFTPGLLLDVGGGRTLELGGITQSIGVTIRGGDGSTFRIPAGATFNVTLNTTFNADLGGATPTFDNQGAIFIAVGQALDIDAALIHGSGALVQGDGTLDLDDATYGTLDGDFAPGTTPGVLTIIGDFRQGATSTITLELDGTSPGTEHDQLVVTAGPNTTGAAVLDGQIDIVTSFTPSAADTFDVVIFSSRGGDLAGITGLDLGNGTFLDTLFAAMSLRLPTLAPYLVVTGQPTDVLPFRPITPSMTVEVRDGRDNLFTGFTNPVDVALGANPGGATLSGTLSVVPTGGTATFIDLSIDNLASGYTIATTAIGAVGAESDPFDVVPGIIWAADSLLDAAVSGILTSEPDGADRFQITAEGTTTDASLRRVFPRWGPGRERITYSARADGTVPNQLHVADLAFEIDHLTSATDTSTFQPRFSPDGRHLAFVCGPTFGTQDVCIVSGVDAPVGTLEGIADGGLKVFITDAVSDTLGGSGAFAWNPTNPDQLAVVRDLDDGAGNIASQIYFATFDGTVTDSLGRLTDGQGNPIRVLSLDWAPDGSYLAFGGEVLGDMRIYQINADGSNLLELTAPINNFDDVRPVISPDGTEIMFLRNNFAVEASMWSYWRVTAGAAGSEVQITPEVDFFVSSEELAYDWSPDGSEIVLVDTDGTNLGIFAAPATTTASTYVTDRRLVSSDTGVDRADIQPSWRP